jgi:TldD protein
MHESMTVSRRQFLARGSATLVAATIPASLARANGYRGSRVSHHRTEEAVAQIQASDAALAASADLSVLMTLALDAASAAGASYADVRFRVLHTEGWYWLEPSINPPSFRREVGIGVRALYNGYWGYAALVLADLSPDAVARLGREAAFQGKSVGKGLPNLVDLAPTPVVTNGTWTTPIEIDPFTVAWDEKLDVMNGLQAYANRLNARVEPGLHFQKEVQSYASTEGSRYLQTLYRTQFQMPVFTGGGMRSSDDFLSGTGAGWEYILNAPIERELPRLIAQANDIGRGTPAEVGRYDVVFDAVATAKLAKLQLGAATELDRAMGYLANTQGTSYVNDPLGMIGNRQMGASLLNVTTNRSVPTGTATVKWDDEGVAPDEAVLVKDGILTDFHTNRESASWLKDYYAKTGKPVRSHGGMTRGAIEWEPELAEPNLVIAPAARDTSFADLCAGVTRGLAVYGGEMRADQQMLNTEGRGEIVYEIRNGKLGRPVSRAIILSRAPDLWKNLVALGGRHTVREHGVVYGLRWRRPGSTVSAPAAAFKNVAIITDTPRFTGDLR